MTTDTNLQIINGMHAWGKGEGGDLRVGLSGLPKPEQRTLGDTLQSAAHPSFCPPEKERYWSWRVGVHLSLSGCSHVPWERNVEEKKERKKRREISRN